MTIRKALTFRASSIGDCLMGKYLLDNIHAQFPDARLGIIVASRGAMIRDLLAASPWIEVIEANRSKPAALWKLWRDFHGSDIVVTQYAGKPGGKFSLSSKLAGRILAKRGGLIGFADASAWSGAVYDRLLNVEPSKAIADHERDALRAAGMPVSLPFPSLDYVRDDQVLKKFSLEKDAYLIVHLFSGSTTRGLDPEKKRDLIQALAKALPGVRLVLSGGGADHSEAKRVAEGTDAVVIAGEATLQELMNLIAESKGVVSLDTGAAHITAQLKKPLVVLCSCLGANWWLPEQYGTDAAITVLSNRSHCLQGHVHKKYPDCLNMIDVNTVVAHIATVMP